MAPLHPETTRPNNMKAASPRPFLRRRTIILLFLIVFAFIYCLQMKYAVRQLEKVMESRILAEEDLKQEFLQYNGRSSHFGRRIQNWRNRYCWIQQKYG
jgi:cell division protein FtsL